MSELKPCPLCGAEMLTGDAGFMHPEPNEDGQSLDCPLAGMSWRTSYYAAAWNTRAAEKE